MVAARRAMPFLKRAEMVQIVVVDPPRTGPSGRTPAGCSASFWSATA
jgi:hypothetical protein